MKLEKKAEKKSSQRVANFEDVSEIISSEKRNERNYRRADRRDESGCQFKSVGK